jgi:hypothetical protein
MCHCHTGEWPRPVVTPATPEEIASWDVCGERMRMKHKKSVAKWEEAARGRTDEQRLLEHLGIGYSDIATFLPKYYVREGDNLMHKLLVHLGIQCLEVEFWMDEAWFSSIMEFVQDKDAKATYFSQYDICDVQAAGKGYMDRTGRIHAL